MPARKPPPRARNRQAATRPPTTSRALAARVPTRRLASRAAARPARVRESCARQVAARSLGSLFVRHQQRLAARAKRVSLRERLPGRNLQPGRRGSPSQTAGWNWCPGHPEKATRQRRPQGPFWHRGVVSVYPCKAISPGPVITPGKTSIMNEPGLTCHGVGAQSLTE